jgi:hypothetical protein
MAAVVHLYAQCAACKVRLARDAIYTLNSGGRPFCPTCIDALVDGGKIERRRVAREQRRGRASTLSGRSR